MPSTHKAPLMFSLAALSPYKEKSRNTTEPTRKSFIEKGKGIDESRPAERKAWGT